MSVNAVVLWSGGKDSALALHLAAQAGHGVKSLATFAPRKPEFLAHPLDFMECQAKALGLPHQVLTVGKPYRESYEKTLLGLKETGVDAVVTGDIAEVDCHPNWVRECCGRIGLDVVTPLWGLDRGEILKQLLTFGFKVVFSCVKRPWLDDEWAGAELDEVSVNKLFEISAGNGIDLCGENGEYHTLVLDGPPFKKSIRIDSYTRRQKGMLTYIDVDGATLMDRQSNKVLVC